MYISSLIMSISCRGQTAALPGRHYEGPVGSTTPKTSNFSLHCSKINSNGNEFNTSARYGAFPGYRRSYAHQWLGQKIAGSSSKTIQPESGRIERQAQHYF